MTQLDRLEALAEKWKEPGKRWYGIATVNEALPDLIRVARAAREDHEPHWDAWSQCATCKALAPLFSEVES